MGVLKRRSPITWLLRRIERSVFAGADIVVVLLPNATDYFGGRGMAVGKIRYIPNGVVLDTDICKPDSSIAKLIADARAGGEAVAVYAGAHGRANGLVTVVDAAAKLLSAGAPVRVLLIGNGPEKAKLIEHAAAHDVRNVVFLPPVPKREVRAVLEMCDLAIFHLLDLPVFRYGISSNKLFDYLAAALPVVFACDSRYDPVEIAGCGISVSPQDADAMATALQALAALTPVERRALGARGRDFIESKHSISVLASAFEDALLEAILRHQSDAV
jgi:glycosyltransferase involved in cell wall biosynthesis